MVAGTTVILLNDTSSTEEAATLSARRTFQMQQTYAIMLS